MERNLMEELYPEILQPKAELGQSSVLDSKQDFNGDELRCGDISPWNDVKEELDVTDLDKKWQRRRNQFHTEASAQKGFNVGFNESAFVGFNRGLVRGFTSALAYVPDWLQERMVETQERDTRFRKLYGSVNSLSTTAALKFFRDDISNKIVKQSDNTRCTSSRIDSHDRGSDCSHLSYYY